MRSLIVSVALVFATRTAAADYLPPPRLQPQVQIDGGLSVIGPAFEFPLNRTMAIAPEVFVFGTYFLPWFDLGDRVAGFGGGLRFTKFLREGGDGLYITPYARFASVGEGIGDMTGVAVTAGAFVGWGLRIGSRWDLRLGGGLQYIYVNSGTLDTGMKGPNASTPFVAIDAVIGYRL
jgi:hypothetical protein